jgi:hypothetical protein
VNPLAARMPNRERQTSSRNTRRGSAVRRSTYDPPDEIVVCRAAARDFTRLSALRLLVSE